MVKQELVNGLHELHGAFEVFRAQARSAVPREMVGVQHRDDKPFQLWGHLFASECIDGREVTVPYIFQTFVNIGKPKEVSTVVDGNDVKFNSPWFHYALTHPVGFSPPINAGEITPEDMVYVLHRTQSWILDLPQSPFDMGRTYKKVLSSEEMVEKYRQMHDFLSENPDRRDLYSRYIEFVANEMILKEREVRVVGRNNLLVITFNNGEIARLTSIEH